MLSDPLSLKGINFINTDNELDRQASSRIARGRKWLQILSGQEGLVNAWMGLTGENTAVQWVASVRPGSIPPQFTENVIREVLETREPFTFLNHAELVSGGLFPLVKADRTLGVIGMISDQTDFFRPADIKWITALAGFIANELSAEDDEKSVSEIEYSISRLLYSTLDVKEGLPPVLRILAEALSADAVIALRYNPLSVRFELLMTHGLKPQELARLNFHLDTGRTGRPLEGPVWIADLQDRTRKAQTISPLKEDGFRGYLALPLSKEKMIGALEFAWRSPRLVLDLNYAFLERVTGQIAALVERTIVLNSYRELNAELMNRYNAMIEGLSRALELRDLETQGHTRRVSELTMHMVEHMGRPVDDWDAIRQGALLHDIGKIGIPDAILLKPGSLTERERQVMQQHVILGYNILAPITNAKSVLDITLYHHERWDGSGYPYGLKGEQIPLVARVFAYVDVFDALTSDRPYRTAWSRTQALDYIISQSGRLFDPNMTDLFLKVVNKNF